MPAPEDESTFDTATGPDAAELPEDPPDLDEIAPFEADPGEFEDVDEFVTAEWRESTTARERVRDVIYRTTTPTTAAAVADRAAVSAPTARTTLGSLADEGVVQAEPGASGTVYRRDPDWYRLKRVRQLADVAPETIESVLRRIEREITGYRAEYGVDAPDDVLLERGSVDDAAWRDVSEWRTAIVDRQYLKTALQFRRLRSAEANDVALDADADDSDDGDRDALRP